MFVYTFGKTRRKEHNHEKTIEKKKENKKGIIP